MTLPPEILGLSSWTELCELHDWDEDEAKDCLTRFIHAKTPNPTGRVRELCELIVRSVTIIKMKPKEAECLPD